MNRVVRFVLCIVALFVLAQAGLAQGIDFATKADYRAALLEGYLPDDPSLQDGTDTCTTPTPIGSLPFMDTGTTVGKTDTVPTLPLACNGNYTTVAGPDAIYEVTLGPGNNVTFNVTTSEPGYDPSIYLVSACGDGTSCTIGADNCFAANAPGNPCGAVSDEEFTASGLAAGTYFFYVDSFYTAASGTGAGPFTLNVTGTLGTLPWDIGGTVAGLTGTGLVLQNNGGDDLAIAADGPFTFATQVMDGDPYDVTVLTQPTGPEQVCTVTNGSGTVAGADVTDVEVDCVAVAYTVGGTVNGLAGSGLVLQNNGGDDLAIAADGAFTFTTPITDGDNYDVTVFTQPTGPGQVCTVTNGSGTVSGADVTNVEVNCAAATYAVGGTVSGLTGSGLILQNNGGDDLAIAADGPFTFPTPVADGAGYNITILAQPTGPAQNCTITNGTGTVSGGDIVDVDVSCVGAPVEPAFSVPMLDHPALALLILLVALIGGLAVRSFATRG